MKKMNRFPAITALVVMAMMFSTGCEMPPAEGATTPETPEIEAVAQQSDSVTYQATWEAGRNPDGTMAPNHDWSTGADDESWGPIEGTVVAADSASDGTLSAQWTAPKDSTQTSSYFCVSARNQYGSTENACSTYTVPELALPPSMPGTPSIDTVATDTTASATNLDSVEVWPDSAEVAIGDSVALHAFQYPTEQPGKYSCVRLTDGRVGLMRSQKGSSAPTITFSHSANFIEKPGCAAEWTSQDTTIVTVSPAFVFRSDSGTTGVRSVQYGIVIGQDTVSSLALNTFGSKIQEENRRERLILSSKQQGIVQPVTVNFRR